MAARRGLKRTIHRAMEELKATYRIAKMTSFKDAAVTFRAKIDIQIMNRNGFQEPPVVRKRLQRKHEVMLEYFEKEYASFLREYDYNQSLPETDPALRDCIWVCWWQGLENAPELVQRCVESIRNNAGNHQVIVVCEENYAEYVDIPAWVESRYSAGLISRTHFSDILRLSLLATHGGVWLDATFFCTEESLDTYFKLPAWTIKRPDYLHASVASGQFATYSLGCQYENRRIFAVARDFLLHYWETNDMLIDYLMLDYIFVLTQRADSRIMEAFTAIAPNNTNCDELVKVLNKPFDVEKWQEIKKDTSLFKLTWKQEFQRQRDGKDTFYAALLDGKL